VGTEHRREAAEEHKEDSSWKSAEQRDCDEVRHLYEVAGQETGQTECVSLLWEDAFFEGSSDYWAQRGSERGADRKQAVFGVETLS
jgi:hypothetical protein